MNNNTLNSNENSKITISDVAEALGVSKTTVSRAMSGKGRISEETRKKVMEYIEANNYKPSVVAKGLVNNRKYNIGWVMPGDSGNTELPFFQRCLRGVSEVATTYDYDILFTMVFDNDISQLVRIVENEKVDGIILGRTLINDESTEYLKEHNLPFVVIGSSYNDDIIQIDNDHVNACKELTSILILKGIKHFALIGGDMNHIVNQTRLKGFNSCFDKGNSLSEQVIRYIDCSNNIAIERAVDEILKTDSECIICMDDGICQVVLNKLHKDGVSVPGRIKIASFYNSDILSSNQPPITALQYDPKELGSVACKTLFDLIEGDNVADKVLLSYEVNLKGSTQ